MNAQCHIDHQAVTVLLSRWNIVQISRLLSSFPGQKASRTYLCVFHVPLHRKNRTVSSHHLIQTKGTGLNKKINKKID